MAGAKVFFVAGENSRTLEAMELSEIIKNL